MLDDARAAAFSSLALGHLEREYPNKLDHVLSGPGDARGPRELHPIFFGSFDWHSCVHGYWLLARLLRKRPAHGAAAQARALLSRRITEEGVEGELAYLRRAGSQGFERPYGWAWLLMLAAELAALGDPAAGIIAPLAEAFAERFTRFLPKADYPVRAGSHGSSAFALRLALVWAEGRDPALAELVRRKAELWFAADADARPFEPSGDDFLSPTLIEAELMRAVLPPDRFGSWFRAFLPDLHQGRPAALFEPARVSDRSDGKIAHLDGLNLSRAWCLRALAGAAGEGDLRGRLETSARAHMEASLPHVAGDYMGEHWLASFALLALDGG